MASEPAALLLDRLVQALLDEERARNAVHGAIHKQAELLRALRRAGLSTSAVAHRVALARGAVLPVKARQRLAASLRQRMSRVTRRHGNLAVPHGHAPSPDPGSGRAILPINDLESKMAKLVKRTVTEEFIEKREDEELEDGEELDDDAEVDNEEEHAPRHRSKGRGK